jgi:hypothetical protein
MMLFAFLALSPLLGAAAATLGTGGVRRASAGLDGIAFLPLAASSTIGAALCVAIPLLRAQTPFDGLAAPALLACAGALLAALAHVDRSTAWAPDALMLPAVAVIFGLGSAAGTLDLDLLPSIGLGALVFLLAQLAWIAARRAIRGVPPPADLLAMLLPLPVLGFSAATVAFYISISLIMVAYRFSFGVRRIFAVAEAMRGASSDVGLAGVGEESVTPFLALSAPVALVLFAFFFPVSPLKGGW